LPARHSLGTNSIRTPALVVTSGHHVLSNSTTSSLETWPDLALEPELSASAPLSHFSAPLPARHSMQCASNFDVKSFLTVWGSPATAAQCALRSSSSIRGSSRPLDRYPVRLGRLSEPLWGSVCTPIITHIASISASDLCHACACSAAATVPAAAVCAPTAA